jgi:hypothetical protein
LLLGIRIAPAPPQVHNLSARPTESHPEHMFLLVPFQHPFRVCSPVFDSAV